MQPASSLSKSTNPPARKPVLVVEDAVDIRESIQELLELDGYQVFTAANGALAFDKLVEIPKPCLILLDLMMPVMDGYQFLHALNGSVHHGRVAVVLVSANNNLESAAKLPHVVAYLRKPFELDDLMSIVVVHSAN